MCFLLGKNQASNSILVLLPGCAEEGGPSHRDMAVVPGQAALSQPHPSPFCSHPPLQLLLCCSSSLPQWELSAGSDRLGAAKKEGKAGDRAGPQPGPSPWGVSRSSDLPGHANKGFPRVAPQKLLQQEAPLEVLRRLQWDCPANPGTARQGHLLQQLLHKILAVRGTICLCWVLWVREAKCDSNSLGCPVGHSCRANIASSGQTVVKPLPSATFQSELWVQASHEAATLRGGQALVTHHMWPPSKPHRQQVPSLLQSGQRVRWSLAASPRHRGLQGSAAAWASCHP